MPVFTQFGYYHREDREVRVQIQVDDDPVPAPAVIVVNSPVVDSPNPEKPLSVGYLHTGDHNRK